MTNVLLLLSLSIFAQVNPHAYRGDDSDWWSILRQPDEPRTYQPGHREPPPSNFEIFGVTLGDDKLFQRVASKFGEAPEVYRGDASTARDHRCYTSADHNTYLIFETGEVSDAFYLFTGGPNWNGSEHCANSDLVAPTLQTASGLHLGESPSEVKAVLGVPSLTFKDKLIYRAMVQKRTLKEDLDKVRRQNPQMSEKEFHDNFGFYTLSTHIEIRFINSKATYIAASESEVY